MNAIILGRRRQGKSTLAERLALLRHESVIVSDPNRQFEQFNVVSSVEEVQDIIEMRVPHVTVFRPNPSTMQEDFASLCELLWKYGNYSFIVDEATSVQSPHYIHPWMERFLRQAPRDGEINKSGEPIGVTLLQTCHRLTDLNPLSRALVSDWFFFRTTLALDLQNIQAQFGPEVSAGVSKLEAHHCLHVWSDASKDNAVEWTEPKVWFMELRPRSKDGVNERG